MIDQSNEKERAMIFGDDEKEDSSASEEEKKIGDGAGEGTEESSE